MKSSGSRNTYNFRELFLLFMTAYRGYDKYMIHERDSQSGYNETIPGRVV